MSRVLCDRCRRSWRIAAVMLSLIISPATVSAQSKPRQTVETSGQEFITAPAQQAIERGLTLLAARQHGDGSFGSESRYRRNIAVTSLAGMALLSAGSTPGRGRFGKEVDRAIEFVLDCAQPSGYLIRADSAGHGPMYGHGFATLFLAEVYGMSPRAEIRQALQSAVQLIINSQNDEGGWRYEPDGREADISVTVCQMMALRAARNCGLAVPKETVDRCIEYVRKCQNSDGGFRYQLRIRPTSEFPRSAAGVVALYSAGVYEGADLERALMYLERNRPTGEFRRLEFNAESHYFYGHYYAVQAMWHAGGDHWRKWYPTIRDELLTRQMPDGSWLDAMINPEYGTAMALLVLEMPNNYLPIFQR